MGAEWYEAQGIEVRDTDRGGRVTYHGPGPAGRLPDRRPARPTATTSTSTCGGLERVTIASLAEHGVEARTIEGLTGVWTRRASAPGTGVRVAARRARSARSASTSAAGSPPTGWRSTSTTTCSRSSGSCPAGSRACAMTSLAPRARRRAGPRRLRRHARRPLRRGLRARAGRRRQHRRVGCHDHAPVRPLLFALPCRSVLLPAGRRWRSPTRLRAPRTTRQRHPAWAIAEANGHARRRHDPDRSHRHDHAPENCRRSAKVSNPGTRSGSPDGRRSAGAGGLPRPRFGIAHATVSGVTVSGGKAATGRRVPQCSGQPHARRRDVTGNEARREGGMLAGGGGAQHRLAHPARIHRQRQRGLRRRGRGKRSPREGSNRKDPVDRTQHDRGNLAEAMAAGGPKPAPSEAASRAAAADDVEESTISGNSARRPGRPKTRSPGGGGIRGGVGRPSPARRSPATSLVDEPS